jgi:putative hydrolase of the HAD superfamily
LLNPNPALWPFDRYPILAEFQPALPPKTRQLQVGVLPTPAQKLFDWNQWTMMERNGRLTGCCSVLCIGMSPPAKREPKRPAQTLLIDADDTLWENNIYFERVIASFISLLDHKTHSAEEIRAILNQCEHETIRLTGYGLASFEKSLLRCFERVRGVPASKSQTLQIRGFARSIAEEEIELLPGVAETLPGLAARHTIILTTKGDPTEQMHKLERSGIKEHFTAVEVPAEKHVAAYLQIVGKYGLDPRQTWMIGNSPRSDINPAIAAGLHAVYIHHPNTWVLEHDELTQPLPPQQLLEVSDFSALRAHF